MSGMISLQPLIVIQKMAAPSHHTSKFFAAFLAFHTQPLALPFSGMARTFALTIF